MKLVFLPSTKSDVRWFRQYYQTVFPEGATRAQQQFVNCKEMLTTNPFIGHVSAQLDSVRELHIARTPFTIIYRVTDTHIEILRVWDERQGESF